MRLVRPQFLLALCLALTACASALVKPGPAVAAKTVAVDTPIAWTRYPQARGELWTVDGALLDRLEFYSEVREGEHVFKSRRATRSKPDGPFFKPGMDGKAIEQLVVDGLSDTGGLNVAASNLRPAKYGPVDGVRFELQLASREGLIYRGMALAAEVGDRLTVLVYVAPAEHYFEAYAPAVEKILGSARPKP